MWMKTPNKDSLLHTKTQCIKNPFLQAYQKTAKAVNEGGSNKYNKDEKTPTLLQFLTAVTLSTSNLGLYH